MHKEPEVPWLRPVITALGMLKQEDHCEFEGNLGYTVNWRLA